MNLMKIYHVYARVFAKVIFLKANRLMFNLSLRGLGVYNYQNLNISGEQKFLETYLCGLASPVVFDVGAHKAEYTCCCIRVNEHAKVYAFEPHPKTFEVLRNNVSDGNVVFINKGLSSSRGRWEENIPCALWALRNVFGETTHK